MNDFDGLKHIMPFLVPIVAIIMGIGIAMLAIWTDYRKKREIFELHHKERMLAIERGMEVPPLPEALLAGRQDNSQAQPDADFKRGLMWTLVGAAVATALIINRDTGSAAWALIPVAVGAAYLITYSRRQAQAGQNAG